jgi:IclR family acetate operon transcriptional repressor
MRNRRESKQTPPIQSLDRGLVILEAVARSADPVSLNELTDLLCVDRSSAFRLANTLKRRGFLAYPGGRRDYILGPSIWRLSRRYDWSNMLIRVSHEYLKQLAAQTQETAHIAIREGSSALFIDQVTTNHVIAVSGQTGEFVPLYCTAHGKAMLADLNKADLKALFGRAPFRSYTKQTIVSLDRLAKACTELKAQGFTTDDGEYIEGIRCVAAPIRTEDGDVIGSIGISAPVIRFPPERYQNCGEQVRKVAEQIQLALSNNHAVEA